MFSQQLSARFIRYVPQSPHFKKEYNEIDKIILQVNQQRRDTRMEWRLDISSIYVGDEMGSGVEMVKGWN
ncbi:hypothetical protein P3L10_022817 [Capsicum annuum]